MNAEIGLNDIGIKNSIESDTDTVDKKSADKVTYWLKELAAAVKVEKEWRKSAREVVKLYEGAKKDEYQYNILYSNTDTLQPALYNSTPRPIVQRRFKDEDPLGKMAAKAGERLLAFLMDSGDSTYVSFDDFMKSATLEALVPGRGVTRFKYDATITEVENLQAAEASPEPDETEEGEPEAAAPTVEYETVCAEEVPWDRFNHGAAKKWQQVPWVSFDHYMTREELEKNFGAVGAKVPVTEILDDSDKEDDSDRMDRKDINENAKVAKVTEIWDKTSKTVIFVSPQWKTAPLREVADPLNLQAFFPCPKPLAFMQKINTLVPVPLYQLYEAQAKELNTVTFRINKIVKALKVRGFYDNQVEGMDKVMAAEDNVLTPIENVAALLGQGGKLENAIFLMPIEKLVAVLQQLYLQRTQVKAVIFEITGIADIMRGSSQASETLGAQQIKNQWGTLRLKKAQKEVMRYTRDCLRLMLEIGVSKLAPETIKKMTGLPFPTGMEKSQAQQQLQQMQMQQQMQAQMAQQMGQPPQPPQPPPQELAMAAGMPSWDELLGLLQDDLQRNYRVDIETNSTIDAEATEDKEDVAEVMNAISQFMMAIGPLVSEGTMPFGVAQKMMLAIVRRFRFGTELEDELQQMQPPKPKGDPKVEAEIQKAKADIEGKVKALEQQDAQLKQKTAEADMQLAMERKQFEMDKMMAEKELEMERKLAEKQLAMDRQLALKELDFAKQMVDAAHEQKVKLDEAKHAQKMQLDEHRVQLKEQRAAESAQKSKESHKELAGGLDNLGKVLTDTLEKVNKSKVARKQPDGSWKSSSE